MLPEVCSRSILPPDCFGTFGTAFSVNCSWLGSSSFYGISYLATPFCIQSCQFQLSTSLLVSQPFLQWSCLGHLQPSICFSSSTCSLGNCSKFCLHFVSTGQSSLAVFHWSYCPSFSSLRVILSYLLLLSFISSSWGSTQIQASPLSDPPSHHRICKSSVFFQLLPELLIVFLGGFFEPVP